MKVHVGASDRETIFVSLVTYISAKLKQKLVWNLKSPILFETFRWKFKWKLQLEVHHLQYWRKCRTFHRNHWNGNKVAFGFSFVCLLHIFRWRFEKFSCLVLIIFSNFFDSQINEDLGNVNENSSVVMDGGVCNDFNVKAKVTFKLLTLEDDFMRRFFILCSECWFFLLICPWFHWKFSYYDLSCFTGIFSYT